MANKTGRNVVAAGALFLVLLAFFLWRAVDDLPSSGGATVGPPDPPRPPAAQTTRATAAAAPATDPCDAHARWFDHHLQGTPEENRRAFVAELRAWSAECRSKAMRSECATRCDAFVSDMILEAAADSTERLELLRWRVDRNKESVALGKDFLGRVRKLHDYAQSIRSSPRGLSPACMTRMRADFDRIEVMKRETDEKLPLLPIGFVGVRVALSYAKGCLDCSDSNRFQCDDMNEELRSLVENLTHLEGIVAADEKAAAKIKAAR